MFHTQYDIYVVYFILDITVLFSLVKLRRPLIALYSRLPKNQYFTGWVLCQVAKAHVESVDYHSAEKCFEDARRVDPHRLEVMQNVEGHNPIILGTSDNMILKLVVNPWPMQ